MENESKNKNTFLKKLFKRTEVIFGACFIVVFFISFTLMYSLGLIPTEFLSSSHSTPSVVEKLQDTSFQNLGLEKGPSTFVSNAPTLLPAENPIRIEAPSILLNSIIVNPTSQDYQTLDNALLQGAVHYPGSGSVENGNMFIFGHSTGYKYVNNKAYQVFNNIHTLEIGDEINVYTSGKKYTYKVTNVHLVDGREELVDFSSTNHMLTLSTCNSFGQKTDRYVVQAQFDHTIDI